MLVRRVPLIGIPVPPPLPRPSPTSVCPRAYPIHLHISSSSEHRDHVIVSIKFVATGRQLNVVPLWLRKLYGPLKWDNPQFRSMVEQL